MEGVPAKLPGMDGVELDRRLAEARRIAEAAGRIALEHRRTVLDVEVKDRQDYVTAADREVEAWIRGELARSFPGEAFLGEESGPEGLDASRGVWICDPIDGTTNYVLGLPLFAIALAYVEDGKSQIGVTHLPALDETYTARRGGGAFLGDERLRVRSPGALDRAVIGVGFSLRRNRDDFAPWIQRLFAEGGEFRRLGSAAVCLAYVARGSLDGFWQAHLHSWDVTSGLLLVEEAGGRVCDFLAGDGLVAGNPVLASGGDIGDALSEVFDITLGPARAGA